MICQICKEQRILTTPSSFGGAIARKLKRSRLSSSLCRSALALAHHGVVPHLFGTRPRDAIPAPVPARDVHRRKRFRFKRTVTQKATRTAPGRAVLGLVRCGSSGGWSLVVAGKESITCCLLGGFAKCGTSHLHRVLSSHSQVFALITEIQPLDGREEIFEQVIFF